MSVIKAPLPRKLEIEIGGFPGPYYSIKILDSALIYAASHAGIVSKESKLIPNVEDWANFLTSLEAINIWSWHKIYMPKAAICDGAQWSIWITWGKKSIRSEGDNAFPDTFDLFTRAVKELIGGLELE